MKRETFIWSVVLLASAVYLAHRFATVGMGSVYVSQADGLPVEALTGDVAAGTAEFSLSNTIGVWVAAFFTLSILSFLYRDNPFYKFAEAVVVGVSAAYWMVVGFWDVLVPNLIWKIWPALVQSTAMPDLAPLREPNWYMSLIPLILGIMLLWRLAPKGAWISRWPLAFVIGIFAGLRMIGFLQADFLSQIQNSIVPLVVEESGAIVWWESVRYIVLTLSVLAGLVYFFFSIEHKGVVGKISKVGIWVLMITFGAAFGYTVMGRFALLAIRLEFLFDDWLWWIDPTGQRLGF